MANIPGSAGNDILVVTGSNNYLGGAGDDTYLITPALAAGTVAQITDTEGTNVVQLVDGLAITSSIFTNNAVELTLSNGAKVQVLGADNMTFQTGANATSGDVGASQTYAQFATALGVATLPAAGGTPATGTANYVVPTGNGTAATYALTSAGSVAEGSPLTFTLTASQADAAAAHTFNLTVVGDTLSGAASAATTTGVGNDFSTVPTSVTLPAGATSATFQITPTADNAPEGSEGFKVSVLNGSATIASATALITDSTVDLTAPVVTASQSFSYAENQANTATVLGTVSATDDIGVTGFSIASGNDQGYFAIDATGKITLTTAGMTNPIASNDFETAPNSFTLGIVADDAAGNHSTATNVTLNVTDVDDVAPTLATVNPVTLAGTTLSLNFNETLQTTKLPIATDFSVVAGGSTSVAVNSVTVSGSTVTLALATTPVGTVTVAYAPNADATKDLQDAAGNKVVAISAQTAVVDTVAPTLSGSTPADNATGVAVIDNIVLNFSETVQAGTGNIVITNASDSTDTRTIGVADLTQVTFNGSAITINPTQDLKAGINYIVTMASGVVKDIAGNAFTGISGTSLDFYTTGASSTGQTFTLTTATDAIPGLKGTLGTTDNSGNDTIIGEFATSPANTLNASDQVNGGNGTDIFKLYGTYDAAQTPVSITNVETLDIVVAAAANLDLSSYTKAASGITAVMIEDAALLTAHTVTTTTGQSLSLGTGTTGVATAGAVTWAGSAADTSLNLTLSGYQGGVGVTPLALTVTGAVATTANITSTGAMFNRVSTLSLPATTTGVVIAGDKGLAVTTDFVATGAATGIKSINASTSTGGVSIQLLATTNTAFAFTGGSGNDTISFANDNLGSLTSGGQLDGGAGTADKIGLLDTAISTAEYTAINAAKNFEVLGLNAAVTVDASQLTSIKTFSLDTDAAQSITSMKTGSVANVTAAHATNITLGSAVGVNDVAVNIGVSPATAATAATAGITLGGTLSIAQPTITMTSNGTNAAANIITALTLADSAAVTLSGSNALTITAITAPTTTGHQINGSGMTAKLTATVNNAAYSAGSSKGDILIGGSAADALTAGLNSSSLTGNGGADTFSVAGAVTGGTSNANITTITDFTKGDKLVFTAATAFTTAKVDLTSASTEQGALDLLLAGSASDLKWGVYGGNTYLVDDTAASAVMAATDVVVKLTGTLDLALSTLSSNTLTFA